MRAAELFDISGRVALVTGASSGLGARFARVLAANGAKVALLARRADRLEALADEIRRDGGTAIAVVADVSDPPSVEAALDTAEAAFGGIGILINNAGLAREGRAADVSFESWREVLDVNLDGAFRVAQAGARRMQAGGGTIVNIASIWGLAAPKGLAAYAVSKAAVVQLTRVMALELAGSGIRVNALAPGYVRTEINDEFLSSKGGAKLARAVPLGRVGETDDLDGALLLMVSDAGRWMTGSVVVVDGGHLLTV